MKRNQKNVAAILVVAVFLVILGSSYAFWVITHKQTGENLVNSSCFKLYFTEQENSNVSLLEGYPLSDEDGKQLIPYTFQIRNECNAKAKYTIRLELDNSTTMNESYIKSMLNTESIKRVSDLPVTQTTLENASKAYLLEEHIINGKSTEEYELRLWIDGSVTSDNKEVMDKVFQARVTVEGEYYPVYTEEILNGTDPVLKEGLIPVTIENDGTVHKADINSEWYRYEEKKWANAVILNDETKVYQNNEVIPEESIESYFVWIPRYRYQIWDNGMYYELSDSVENKAQEIKLVFENKETQLSKGTKKGDWLTHPAFTAFDTNGMWVGKFETGYKGSTDTTSAQKNVNEPESVQIKPNVNSWRRIQVANAYLTSYDYKRDYDSHMMKNTEWGAVAYLQHSKYGSMTSVRINNNENFMTGYSAAKEPTCGLTGINEECNRYGTNEDITLPYNTSVGYLASTTGNINGVYDMSGGSYEYVMGVMLDKEGNLMSGRNSLYHSGFNGTFGCPTCDNDTSGKTELTTGIPFPTDSRYYDAYAYDKSFDIYQRRILGDATGEMGPFSILNNRQIGSWYSDGAYFLKQGEVWTIRDYYFAGGNNAGIFNFGTAPGNYGNIVSFRIVLTM